MEGEGLGGSRASGSKIAQSPVESPQGEVEVLTEQASDDDDRGPDTMPAPSFWERARIRLSRALRRMGSLEILGHDCSFEMSPNV